MHADQIAANNPTPPQALAQQEQRQQILTAIASLSRRQANAVLMRLFEQLPYGQIAAALGTIENNVAAPVAPHEFNALDPPRRHDDAQASPVTPAGDTHFEFAAAPIV